MVFDRNEAAGLPDFETVACVPLKFEGFVQGAICVSGKKEDFVPENLDLLSAIGSEVAVAIENTRLFEKLESQNRELATAVTEIVNLFNEAERKKSFGTRYENLNLTRCWEVKSCDQTACPAYGLEENLRCWQLAGTHCGGEVQGVFAQKLGRCEKCEVYKRACPDRITVLGETFNNMMAILELRVKEHEELQLQLYRSAKLAAIGELAAGVAHEINNPLTGILGNAMLMKSDAGDNKSMLKKISVIESEALRARDIVRNLLDFAHQNNDLARDRVGLNKLIEQTLFLVRHQANLSSVKIDITVEEGLPELAIDANQMKQVFMNIIHNAIHSMQHGGTLEIKARGRKTADPDEVEISFKDSGCGMDADAMSRIFDPFFTTKNVGEGTGLGLSVSQRIVDDHGGKILVSSQPGEGSTFTVVLPLNNPAREMPRQVA
jgi:nitrogen-specific signal transduction histidine kinase